MRKCRAAGAAVAYTGAMPGPLQFAIPSALDYFATLVAEDESLSLVEAAAMPALWPMTIHAGSTRMEL